VLTLTQIRIRNWDSDLDPKGAESESVRNTGSESIKNRSNPQHWSQAVLRIRIFNIRIRIQPFFKYTDPDPDPDPDPGYFMTQK